MFDTFSDFSSPLTAMRAFVEHQRGGLLNAAELLGGPDGLRLAHSVIDGLGRSHLPTERTLSACRELLDLLMLEHVHEPVRIKVERFALIDPAWPIAEEICLLAAGLQGVLETYFEDAGQQPVQVAA